MADREFDRYLEAQERQGDDERAVFGRLVKWGSLNGQRFAPVNVAKATRETGIDVRAAINRLIAGGYLEREHCVDSGARNNSYRILLDPTELPDLDDIEI